MSNRSSSLTAVAINQAKLGFAISVLMLALAWVGSVAAHEVRPGYIDIVETADDQYDIKWKQPVRDSQDRVAGLGLRPVFPVNCAAIGEHDVVRRPGALVERFRLRCAGGLIGQPLGVEGLQRTITDVFVHIKMRDNTAFGVRLTPQEPVIILGAEAQSVWSYLAIGFEHLVLGFDHILFIIGLALVAAGWRRLIWVVTAFTLAHSITLALSVFDLVRVPPAAIEAVIALSIIYVALEIGRTRSDMLVTRYPQAIAFMFGLVHGFGFAGVLSEIGLPRGEVALALLLFNIGLEIGQLAVIALLACMGIAAVRLGLQRFRPLFYTVTSLAMGGIASFWVITRSVSIFI